MHDKKINFDINNSKHVYLLGYFWADCYFGFNKHQRSLISFEIKSEDFFEIKEIIKDVGFKSVGTRIRNNGKQLSKVACSQATSMKFFIDNCFHKKRDGCYIYFQLSNEMKPFFIKGVLDGDGSISLDKNGLFRVGFNGPKNQNWDFLENFCFQNNISYTIYRKERKSHHNTHKKETHEYSVFEFTKNKERLKFCDLISFCDIGLSRKMKIYFNFKENFEKHEKEKEINKNFQKRMIQPSIEQTSPSKYRVCSLINKCGIQKYIGVFETLEEAIQAQNNFHTKHQI